MCTMEKFLCTKRVGGRRVYAEKWMDINNRIDCTRLLCICVCCVKYRNVSKTRRKLLPPINLMIFSQNERVYSLLALTIESKRNKYFYYFFSFFFFCELSRIYPSRHSKEATALAAITLEHDATVRSQRLRAPTTCTYHNTRGHALLSRGWKNVRELVSIAA